jgi:tetratricopeptide (TPR) repeat protein
VKHLFPILFAVAVATTTSPPGASSQTAGQDTTKARPEATTKPAAAAKPVAAKEAPDSLALLEKAVARDSSKFDNLYKLGVTYLDRDRPEEAIRVLTRASRMRPKDVRVLVNLGAAHDAGGHPDEAQRRYRAALAQAPGDSVASCRLASSLYSQAKHQEAVDLLRDIIRDRPASYCAYFTLGVAFADAGIYRDAIRMWKRVIELSPSSPEAISSRESIEVLEKFIGK